MKLYYHYKQAIEDLFENGEKSCGLFVLSLRTM